MTRREEIAKNLIKRYKVEVPESKDKFVSVYISQLNGRTLADMKNGKQIDSIEKINCPEIFNYVSGYSILENRKFRQPGYSNECTDIFGISDSPPLQPNLTNKKSKKLFVRYDWETGLYRIKISEGILFYCSYLFNAGGKEEMRTVVVSEPHILKAFFIKSREIQRKQEKPKIGIFKAEINSNTGVIEYKNIEKTVPTTCIIHEVKSQIKQHINFYFENKDKFMVFGRPGRKSILMYGPQGTGKSSMLYEISLENKGNKNISFCSSISDLITHVDLCAKHSVPTIAILEDCEGALFQNNKHIKNFLSGVDALQNKSGCYIIFTTNYPKVIETTIIKRKGRIDRLFQVGKLIGDDLQVAIDLYFKPLIQSETELLKVCSLFKNKSFSGAEIEAISQETLSVAANEGTTDINSAIVSATMKILEEEFKELDQMSDKDMDYTKLNEERMGFHSIKSHNC